MNRKDEKEQVDLLNIEKIIADRIVNRVKMARLGHPYAMLAPKPEHFPQFSKCDRFQYSEGIASHDPQIELLYSYGLPREKTQKLVTFPGAQYGPEFADFTIEIFGLKGEQVQEPERLSERQVGDVKYANATLESLPMGAGMVFRAIHPTDTNASHTVYAWRWRVYMNESSLCLENLWQDQSGWIPFVLGIKYDNPEKMVADAIRFAPAFRLCNLVDANLSQRRGGARNVKVANQPEDIKRALGKRYIELKDSLTNVKKDVKAAAEYLGNDWRNHILSKYPILENYPDLIEETDPYKVPSDPEASDAEMAPWEIAFEIAARETIPDYTPRSVSGETLKKNAILPN